MFAPLFPICARRRRPPKGNEGASRHSQCDDHGKPRITHQVSSRVSVNVVRQCGSRLTWSGSVTARTPAVKAENRMRACGRKPVDGDRQSGGSGYIGDTSQARRTGTQKYRRGASVTGALRSDIGRALGRAGCFERLPRRSEGDSTGSRGASGNRGAAWQSAASLFVRRQLRGHRRGRRVSPMMRRLGGGRWRASPTGARAPAKPAPFRSQGQASPPPCASCQ